MTLNDLKGKVSALEAKVAKWLGGKNETKPAKATTSQDSPEGEEKQPEVETEAAAVETIEEIAAAVQTLEERYASANQQIVALTKDKKDLTGQVTQLTTDLNEAKGKVTELEGRLNDPKGTIKTETAKETKKIVASQGLPVDQLPDGKTEGGADPKAKALKTYGDLIAAGKSQEAGEFWQKNRELLKV
jgi:chromosome segregation ATPase